MLASLLRSSGGLAAMATMLPLDMAPYDRVSPDSKTARDFRTAGPSTETGKDRLFMMFSTDDTGTISAELNSIYQAGFLGFLGGAIYGGFVRSRGAYMDFMENNQATAFKSHFDAKKKLQDLVTINFAKGAFKWGWRLGLFTSAYVGIVTTISVYRGRSSLVEYVSAGAVAGSLYKVNMGLRGMAVGGLLGGGIGGVAGCASLLLLHVSGTSMEEVRYWQYRWRENRDRNIHLASKIEERDELLDSHDQKLTAPQMSLDQLEATTPPAKASAATASPSVTTTVAT